MAPSTERDNKQRCRRNVFSSYHFHKLPQLNHLDSHIYNDPVTYCKFLRCYKDLGDINHELNEINKRIINNYTSIINLKKDGGGDQMAGHSLGAKRRVKFETISLFMLPMDPFGSI